MTRTEPLEPIHWRPVFSALCAVLVGIGFSRFAYAPLVPALITESWFDPAEAGYLGAANFAGYLAGAAAAGAMARRMGSRAALRLMMIVASASFFACAAPLSFLWFFAWRFAAGLAGGVLMVLAASAVLPAIAAKRRGLAGGLIFTGVGVGIAASGTAVPFLLRLGLSETWVALGAAAALATVAAWGGWPAPRAPSLSPALAASNDSLVSRAALAPLAIAYALAAVGLVPHMVFLVDYTARGLGFGIETGSIYWVLFGMGALAGPICAGRLADLIGFRSALVAALAVSAVATGLPAVSGHSVPLGLSSLLVGAFVPGIVPLVLGRIHEIIPSEEARREAWGRATIAFAAGQAGGGFLFSFIFAQSGGSYPLLFGLGAAALAISLVISLGASALPVAQDSEAPREGSIVDLDQLKFPAEDRQ